jgi:hypothetical protein
MVYYKGIHIISPDSHIWVKMKRIPNGTCCQICSSAENLYAYRGTTGSNTLCNTCLNRVRAKNKKRNKMYGKL